MPRIVLFDADGVIQKPAADWRPALEALAPDTDSVDRLLEDIFAAEKLCVTGEKYFGDALAPVLSRWEISRDVTEILDIWTRIEVFEENLAIVQAGRDAGVTTGLATNQQDHRARHLIEGLGYNSRFDHLFISCQLGVAKPSADYFRVIADRLGIAAPEMVFVDDHPANVDAARSVGVAAAVYELSQGAEALRGTLTDLGVQL